MTRCGVLRDGLIVKEVADTVGVTRQAMHKWLRRNEAGGLGDLEAGPRKAQ